ncbi:leucine-rich repeat domain-containing protein [Legionella saoudiensis]|uniref:leucine-rich repeat domain-containing protein n=1 Tax=Legionella saoudiensis TaxID=1750561 RepID=UPI00073098F8|nr:leucine-rich repeat domain-containing protein [Legionella saoudiensis]
MLLSDDKTVLVKVTKADIKPDGSCDIPESVTRIKSKAFLGRDSLKIITIPPRVTAIGAYAFKRCISLHIIQFLATDIKINENAFLECEGVHSIVISGDDESQKQVINQLPKPWHHKIVSTKLAQQALQLVDEQLSSVKLVPEINPLHLFLSHDAPTTKAKIKNNCEHDVVIEYNPIPDDLFHYINTFLGDDNIYYRRAAMLMYREPLPRNDAERETYQVKLQHLMHEAITEPLELQEHFTQQLKDILACEKELRTVGHIDAADAMHALFQKVYAGYKVNYSSNIIGFLKESYQAINETRTRLNENAALNYPAAIVTFFGGGAVSLFNEGYRQITGRRHHFFQSVSSESLDALEDGLGRMAKIQPH